MSEENNHTLNEGDELLQGTIDALGGRIAILDYRGNILKINRAWRSFADNRDFGIGSNYLQILLRASNSADTRDFQGRQYDPLDVEIAQGVSEIIDGKKDSFELEYSCQIDNAQHWILLRVAKFGEGENSRLIVNHENKTVRKLTEQALRESEESYRILAETATDVIIKINSDSVILFINHACERVFGYKAAEMLGQPLTMIMPEHLRESHMKGFNRYLKTGKRRLDWEGLEVPAQHRDGHIFPLEISFGEFEQGGKHYFIGVARDISDRKQTEKATAHLAAIVESSDDSIVSQDLNGIITSWNKGAEKVYGYAAEEVVGNPITIILPPHLSDEEQQSLERIKRGEQIENMETVRQRKDGSLINVSVTISPIRDEAGNVVGASRIARDITERKRTEEILFENQMMLSLSMQSSRMGAWEQDIATGVVIWSEELEEIFGLEKNSFDQTREAFHELIHEDDRQRIRAEVDKAVKEHRDYTIEFRFHHADGSIRWMEGRGQAVYSENGAPVRLYGIGIDVTERKRAEQALRDSDARLRLAIDISRTSTFEIDLLTDAVQTDQIGREIYGFEADEPLTFSRIQSHFHPADRDEVLHRVSAAFQPEGAGEFEVEQRIVRTDGKTRWIRVRGRAFFEDESDGSRRAIRCLGTYIDITESKQAEQALRESYVFNQDVIDSLAAHIAVLDKDGTITSVNEAWRQFAAANGADGTAANVGVGANYLNICIAVENEESADARLIHQGISDVLAGKREFFSIEYPCHSPTERRWFLLTVTPMTSDAGGAVISHQNITERRQAEQALRDSEERFRNMADHAPVMIWVTEADGTCTYLSQSWYEFTGQTPETGLGFGWLDVTHPDDYEKAEKAFLAANERHEPFWVEYRLRREDGEYRWAIDSAQPRFSETGEFLGYIGSVIDITERKRAEEMLVERERLAILNSELSLTLVQNKSLPEILQSCAEIMVKHLDAAFARVWTLNENENALELRASAGLYTHLDGEHSRVPVGKYKIGRIAVERKPHLTNAVIGDELVSNQEWAKREEMTAFAGYPLLIGERLLGVLAMFARQPLGIDELKAMESAANIIALGIERKQAEEKLKEARTRLESTLAAAEIGTWTYDPIKDLVVADKNLARLFAVSEADAAGGKMEKYLRAIHEDDRRRVADTIRQSLENGDDYETTYRLLQKDKSVRWVVARGRILRDETGKAIGLPGVVVDVTESKQAEEALRESEGKFRDLANSISQFAWMADASGDIFWYNNRWFEYTGTTLEEMRGWGWQTVHHPDYVETVTKKFKRHLASGKPWEDTFPLRSKTGEYGWFLSRALPIRDENGQIIRWFGTNTDITERKQAQEALIVAERKAAEDYQALLSRIVPLGQTLGTARDLVSIYRAVHEFICSSMCCSGFFVSFYDAKNNLRTAAYVWGEGEEVDIAELPSMPLAPDGSGGANSQAIFRQKTVITNRYWNKMKDRPHVVLQENGVNPMSSMVVPMMIKNEVIGTLEVQAHEDEAFNEEQAVALEMAANLAAVAIENVRLLEVEAKARHVAEEANLAKDEFLSVLSHELRTPLNAIFGWTRMLKSGVLDEKLKNQAIETIERNTRLQNNLIEDILDVSRIISGKMRLDCEKIDFVSVVENCVETAKPLAQEKNIELMFQTQTGSQNIFGDATRLQQIINNLLNNAIKFTPDGGRISVELSRQNKNIRLQITDTGIGISSEFLPLIFDRFRQADSTTKRSHSGLGLGLTIVRHLTELHGGRIEVLSGGENLGSTFVIELPLAQAESERISSANGNGDGAACASKLNGAKILLVDDDPDGLQPLQILLENQRADVSAAFSAREALQKIADAEGRFDILISDIGMPEMDGFELIAEARRLTDQKNYFLPAIALTAYASSQDRERVLSSGYQTHLPKPVNFEEFLSTVNNLLDDSNKE